MKKETESVRAAATSTDSFQRRWYLLEGWLTQATIEKRSAPFSREDLISIRRSSYKDQVAAAKRLDGLYRKADDWLQNRDR